MYRRSFARLGHQLIKEPLGHEENTFARGTRTQKHAVDHVFALAGFCGVGCVLAMYSFVSGQRRVHTCVTAEGKMGKSTCPVRWWNF